jgi:glycosyltransferase involved in cell wall biosynthesis
MLVRDEADTIDDALVRALPVVDHVTLLDTGSVDDTLEIAHETLAGVPHDFFTAEWRGFGPARTQLLEHARPFCDYTLMLDADHVLHIDGERPELTADAYMLRVRGPLEWRLPLLTRTQHPFEYRGVAHSYLHSDVPVRTDNLDWLSIDGGPGATREKLEGDRRLLEQAFLDDPHDTRTVFYLAQTYRDLDEPDLAIRFYLMRANMPGGYDEERYFARYQAGVLLGQHVGCFPAFDQLVAAFRERPTRAEALRALARLADGVADKLAVPDDRLFVTPSAYREAAACM